MKTELKLSIRPSEYAPRVTTAPSRTLRGRVWPSGDFGLSYGQESGWESALDTHIDEHGADNPLGSSLLPISHKGRCPRGSHGITGHGKKTVRSAADMLQRKYGPGRLAFLTLTLPGLPRNELAECVSDWSRIVRVFLQWLSRRLKAAGLSGQVVGVTEIQPERLRERGELAPHLHLVFCGRPAYGGWVLDWLEYRKAWLRTISASVGHPVLSEAVENVQTVKKSAAGYLGKYMSKGGDIIREAAEICPESPIPSDWWHCTTPLRKAVGRACISDRGVLAWLESVIVACPDSLPFVKAITIETPDGYQVTVGYCGRLSRDALEYCRRLAGKDQRL